MKRSGYRLLTAPLEIRSLLSFMLTSEEPVAFDFETTDLYPWKGKIRSVGVSWKRGQAWCFDPMLVPEEFKAWLLSSCPKVCHKYAYELSWCLAKFGVTPRNVVFDTKIGSRLVDENEPSGLGDSVARFGVMDNFKDIAPDFESEEWQTGQTPIETFYLYNCMDAEATKGLMDVQKGQVNLALMRKTLDHVETLGRCRARGIRIKPGSDRALKIRAKTEVPRLLAKMEEESAVYRAFMRENGGHINVRSSQQVRCLCLEFCGLPILHRSTRTERPTCDKDYLALMAGREPLCNRLLEIRSWLTLDSNFLKNLQDTLVDGRIHPDWGVGNTNTWRITCSRPNMQNLPRDSPILSCVIPDEGKVLVEMDYSQMELRIAAALTEEEAWVQAFKNGQDPHKATASRLFKVDPEDVTEEQRQRAKSVNFGVFYGITPQGMWRKFGIPVDEGREILDTFWKEMRRIKQWVAERHEEMREQGCVRNLFGRVRHLPVVDWHSRNQAQNFPVQSVSGEMTLDAMVEIEQEVPYADLLGQKHDSILFQVAHDDVARAVEDVGRIMVRQGVPFGINFEVDAKVGDSWGSMGGYRESSCSL